MAERGTLDTLGAMAGGPGRLAGRLRDLAYLPRDVALARLGYGLKRPVFALPLYHYSLTGPHATSLVVAPADPWPGDAALGAAVLDGRFCLDGRRFETPAPLWNPVGLSAERATALHGFAWLRDLRAAGGDAARRAARELVTGWLAANRVWNAQTWEPLATGQRLASWLGCYEFFAASADITFRHRLLGAMTEQARHLHRVLPAGLTSAELVAATKGLILAGACLPEGESWRAHGLSILRRELRRQILADGFHAERSPARHLAVLRDLIDIRAALHRAEAQAGRAGSGEGRPGGSVVPAELQAAIETMAPALRLFRHNDGGLALFNGSGEEESWRIDMVLQRAGGRRRAPSSAPESGFQRLRAGRTLVVLDAGAPPPPGFDREAHAGTLAFEMSVGRERVVVNCGARRGDPLWSRVQRTTAAHSTLTLADTNSSELGVEVGLGRRARVGCTHQDESEGSLWLEAEHDGYVRGFGLVHRRRLYLAADGADLRGEDRLIPKGGTARGGTYAIRFHLHPQVQAGTARDGATILLRLAKGGGWQFRMSGAASARLEPSVYLGRAGEIRRSQQIVVSGVAAHDGATVKWALQRLP
ncbi:MAG TPA: heparinase II/III family protein, partial [Kiloniellales bacterium]|nr:heparinase II/III family protein [Kiloniellales bacterium]